MCSLPCPASPAAQSYQRNGKSVLKMRIQMPKLSILMWWSVGQVHKTDIWHSTAYGWALCSSFPRSFGFFLVEDRPCSKRSERHPWSDESVGYVPGAQSVTRGPLGFVSLRGLFCASGLFVSYCRFPLVVWSAPRAFWWTSEKWIKKSINAMKQQSTISVITRKGVGRKINQKHQPRKNNQKTHNTKSTENPHREPRTQNKVSPVIKTWNCLGWKRPLWTSLFMSYYWTFLSNTWFLFF